MTFSGLAGDGGDDRGVCHGKACSRRVLSSSLPPQQDQEGSRLLRGPSGHERCCAPRTLSRASSSNQITRIAIESSCQDPSAVLPMTSERGWA